MGGPKDRSRESNDSKDRKTGSNSGSKGGAKK